MRTYPSISTISAFSGIKVSDVTESSFVVYSSTDTSSGTSVNMSSTGSFTKQSVVVFSLMISESW